MNKKSLLILTMEMLWWISSVLLALVVLLPIYLKAPDYPFFISNAVFIIAFVQFTRHIFVLKHSPLARLQYLKVALFFLSIPAVFLLIEKFNAFQLYLDNNRYDLFLGHLPHSVFTSLSSYIYNEMVFFATAAIISAVLFSFRMVVSVWRYRNRGKA